MTQRSRVQIPPPQPTLFEVDGQPSRITQVIEAARKIVPSKPVTQVIVSHHHVDHSSGLREAVAEGLARQHRVQENRRAAQRPRPHDGP